MLNVPQKKAISKWDPLLSVSLGKDTWVTNGVILYRYNHDDEFTKPFDKEMQVGQEVFGTIDHAQQVLDTGMTFDMHLIDGKGSVAVMMAQLGNERTLFLVDSELLKKVKPRGADKGYLLGIREHKKILYNKDGTIGVCCIDDEKFGRILDLYGEVFAAFLVHIKFK